MWQLEKNKSKWSIYDATAIAVNFGANTHHNIKNGKKIRNKAIDHMNCDPLTVSVGLSAYSFQYQRQLQ